MVVAGKSRFLISHLQIKWWDYYSLNSCTTLSTMNIGGTSFILISIYRVMDLPCNPIDPSSDSKFQLLHLYCLFNISELHLQPHYSIPQRCLLLTIMMSAMTILLAMVIPPPVPSRMNLAIRVVIWNELATESSISSTAGQTPMLSMPGRRLLHGRKVMTLKATIRSTSVGIRRHALPRFGTVSNKLQKSKVALQR